MSNPISLRTPAVYHPASASKQHFDPPTVDWLVGRWHVTHSSLPLWKDKRNVTLDYAALPAGAAGVVKIDDTTSYMKLGSDKVKTTHGIDTPSDGKQGTYDWRGTGWLRIASSHWEVLGYGDVPGDGGHQWVVTYFAKTLFTPAGIDIYSRQAGGLPEAVVAAIKNALKGLEAPELRKLVENMFEVKNDW